MKGEKKLLALPWARYNGEMIKTELVEYSSRGHTYISDINLAYYHADKTDDILCVTLWVPKWSVAYRVFIAHGTDYVAQTAKYTNGKYEVEFNRSQSTIRNWLMTYTCVSRDYKHANADKGTDDTIKQWLGDCADSAHMLWQLDRMLDEIKTAKQNRTNNNKIMSIKKYMDYISDLPQNFERWIDDLPLKKYRYIIYKYSRSNVTKGFCTHCQKLVSVSKPRNDTMGICPNCNSAVTYKASGKFCNVYAEKPALYVQPYQDGVVYRQFYATCVIIAEDRNKLDYKVKLYARECRRYFVPEDGPSKLFESAYMHYSTVAYDGWHNSNRSFYEDEVYLYPYNLTEIYQNSVMRYMPWSQLCKKTLKPAIRMIEYIRTGYSIIEQFVKLGMNNALKDMLRLGKEELYKLHGDGSVLKLLDVSKTELKYIRENNLGLKEIECFKRLRKEPHRERVFEFIKRYSKTQRILSDHIAQLLRCMPGKTYRAIDYISAQGIKTGGRQQACQDYFDYLRMARQLGYNMDDTKVLFPYSLKDAHDRAKNKIQIMANEYDYRGITQTYYDYIYDLYHEGQKYFVTMPHDWKDLKYEGDMLDHCVYSTYAKKVAKGTSIIIFIRDKDKPYAPLATAEIDSDYNVIQFRGFGNMLKRLNKDAIDFFEGYKQKVLARLRERQEKEAKTA